jgi:hypothetical protein
VGNIALFAGGDDLIDESATVDMYNAADGSWTTANLTQARSNLAATSVGNVALIAGGFTYGADGDSAVVDMFRIPTSSSSGSSATGVPTLWFGGFAANALLVPKGWSPHQLITQLPGTCCRRDTTVQLWR